MATNDMTFNQVSTILKGVVDQATGKETLTPTNTSEFVTVGQTALKTGYDPIMKSISQILSKTIYSIRPYSESFRGMEMDSIRYGNHVRKIYPCVNKAEDDESFKLAETAPGGVDQYKLRIPGAVQVNFYGENVWQYALTTTRDQLNSAFTSPAELGSFWSMLMDNITNDLAQSRESMRRACLTNYIAGKIKGDVDSVFHLKTEYSNLTGIAKEDIEKPENFTGYVQWLFGRVSFLSKMLEERTSLYHTSITGKEHLTHVPRSEQRVYLSASDKYAMECRAIADVYHNNYLTIGDHESVAFWQSPEKMDAINVKPTYLQTNGTLKTEDVAVEQSNILGVICDRNAFGETLIDYSVDVSPYNAAGKYYNTFFHENRRWYNSFMEKGIILLND